MDPVAGCSAVAPQPLHMNDTSNATDLEAGGVGCNTSPEKPTGKQGPAAMRNLYTAAMSYNGYTITDGALRLIVLLFAADLGFNAIEIAFMFSMYEVEPSNAIFCPAALTPLSALAQVAGVFTNLFGGVVGSKYGLQCTLLTSLVLQIACLAALTQTEPVVGKLDDATPGSVRYLQATVYITAWQALAGVAKDFMKLTGKATPKLVTTEEAEGRLFQLVAWLTGMKNALKGFGSFLGALLVDTIGWVNGLWALVAFLGVFIPLGICGMDQGLGVSKTKKIEWAGVFKKGRNVNVLSAARFFLFGSRDVWFEIGLPLFLRLELGWDRKAVGLVLAGYIVIYGNLQAATTKLFKNADGTRSQPGGDAAYKWAAYCSVVPLLTGILVYFTHEVAGNDVATAVVLVLGLIAFAVLFAVNSSVHSYLIVSYSNKDKVAQDLGFYYMANAGGRLIGVLIGGFLYFYTSEDFGLSMCLFVACPFLVAAAAVAYRLPDPVAPLPKRVVVESEAKHAESVLERTKISNIVNLEPRSREATMPKQEEYRAVLNVDNLGGQALEDPQKAEKATIVLENKKRREPDAVPLRTLHASDEEGIKGAQSPKEAELPLSTVTDVPAQGHEAEGHSDKAHAHAVMAELSLPKVVEGTE